MKRDNFTSKMGVLAANVGAAVGLGNIWKFSYVTGENGGGAFLIVYLLCIALIGLPVMITEFALGRKSNRNAVGAYKELSDKPWYLAGYFSVLTPFIILGYYSMIAGWIISYLINTVTGKISNLEIDQMEGYFSTVASNSTQVLICTFIVLIITAVVVMSGVKKGIEKATKVLMPVLFVILVALMIRSLTLEGAYKGVEFLFKPDFSKLTTKGVLEALGHAFYSLSLGMGISVTYGSYISKKENIGSIALQVTIADTLIAIMAGLVIFPAVFAYGFKPGAGPSLIFITLPAVFKSMFLGNVFQALFFILITIAAVTSIIALFEVVIAFLIEEKNMSRKKSVVLVAVGAMLLAIPSTLSFGAWGNVTFFGKNFFGIFDFITSNLFLPLSGLLVCIFAGWVWGHKNVINEVECDGKFNFKFKTAFSFVIRFLAPVSIIVIFLYFSGILKM